MQASKSDFAHNRLGGGIRRVAMAGVGLAALTLAVVACGGTRPQPDDIKYVGLRYDNPGEIEADRLMYEARCGVCHVAFHPSDFRREQWPALVAEMSPRAGLTVDQRHRVVRYLTTQ